MPTLPMVGDELAGYRLRGVLGRGGMSVVYEAENPRLGSTVALKVLAPELATDDVFRALLRVVNRNAGVLLFDDAPHGFFERHVGRKRKNIRPRHHDLAHGEIGKLEGAMDHIFLHRRQEPDATAGCDHEFQFFWRMDSAFFRLPRSK